MTGRKDSSFSLVRGKDRLVFRAAKFSVDRGSVLHSGIYNREFSSVLASFAVSGLVYFALVQAFGKMTVWYAVFMTLFIGTFPLFRAYVFRERFLETVIDRGTGRVAIDLSWLRRTTVEDRPLSEIAGLRIDTEKTEVVNRDGVEFVEKISAQHGTVIPGFGEETTYYSLMLKFTDGTERTLVADSSMQDVISAHDEIREFLNI